MFFSLMMYSAARIVILIPLVAGVVTLLLGLLRKTWTGAAGSILLGAFVVTGWVLAWGLGIVASSAVVPPTFGELGAVQMAAMTMTSYASWLTLGLLFAVAPGRLGSLALARCPIAFRNAAQASSSMWIRGMRIAGIYFAVYAAGTAAWNSGLPFLLLTGAGV